jgi:hypothetical protein
MEMTGIQALELAYPTDTVNYPPLTLEYLMSVGALKA